VRRRSARDDERGVAANVAVIPAVLVLFFFTVQLCLWFYGREVATAGAQHGLDTARVTEGSAAAGERTTREFLDQIGGLRVRSVAIGRGGDETSVTVTADPIRVLPFVDAPIRVTVTGPTERVAP
jgi:hypothetical protein